MTREQINEGNKLIGDFMEQMILDVNVLYVFSELPIEKYPRQFHYSWDWIIPVVEKIRSLDNMVNLNFWSETNATECVIYNWEDFGSAEIRNECQSSIESVYLSVVEFIRWHNQNSKDGK